jgi:hypothetical protein
MGYFFTRMCFTLNSARECAGSIFQVMVETGANVLVDMLSSPFVRLLVCAELILAVSPTLIP